MTLAEACESMAWTDVAGIAVGGLITIGVIFAIAWMVR